MEDSNLFTPTKSGSKGATLLGSSSVGKLMKDSRNYLPSRYAPDIQPNKNIPLEKLHNAYALAKKAEVATALGKSRLRQTPYPKIIIDMYNKKTAESTEFKTKPLKRYESDYLNFKEIFVGPRYEVLKNIRSKEPTAVDLRETIDLQATNDEVCIYVEVYNRNVAGSPPKQPLDMGADADRAIYFLDSKTELSEVQQSSDFFDEMIKVQPPDLPNSSIASTLTPGNGYAPSIPLTYMIKDSKTNLRDLLVRAKAGVNAEDVQKYAHLSFFLGMVYESRGSFDLAVKFYRLYLGFAKTMEDKIGMALGANRVAVGYYYRGNLNKSITYHLENLKLSDKDNTFAGMYNIGICNRKLYKFKESIEYFESALQWALQREYVEYYCIAHGQLGVTYMKMQLYYYALERFYKCYELSKKLKKPRIYLDNLMYICKITTRFDLKSKQNIEDLFQYTLKNANILQDKRISGITICNLGILKGKYAFYEFKNQHNSYPDVE